MISGGLAFQKSPSQRLSLEAARVSLFVVILSVSLASYLLGGSQGSLRHGLSGGAFINWDLLLPFYSLLGLGLFHHALVVGFLDQVFQKPLWLYTSFIFDSFIISGLIHFSGSQQSFFLFLQLINILLVGLVFGSSGALIMALISSSQFTVLSFLGPDLRALNYFVMLALNNISYFLIAALSGFLHDQFFSTDLELEKTGRSLRASERFSRFIVDHIPTGWLTINSTGLVEQCNPRAEALIPNLNRGVNIFDLWPEIKNLQEDYKELEFLQGGEQKVFAISSAKTQGPFSQEEIQILSLEDLTEYRKLERQLRQSEKLAAIGGLAAGIAHEIRNPLAGISGSIELLSQNSPHEEDQKLMKIILREIDRLNALITEFLDYSRPSVPPTMEVSPAEILRETLAGLQFNKSLRKDVEVESRLEGGESLRVLGDAEKLKQAFLNILINAYQALEKCEGPKLKIILEGSHDGTSVVVRIADNGVGMSATTRERLFEPFFTTRAKGTGLGLAVTHKILESHQAKTEVRSQVGQGTEFTLVFPCSSSGRLRKSI